MHMTHTLDLFHIPESPPKSMLECEIPQEGGLCTFNSSPFCPSKLRWAKLVSLEVTEAWYKSVLILNHNDIKTGHMLAEPVLTQACNYLTDAAAASACGSSLGWTLSPKIKPLDTVTYSAPTK